MRPFLFWIFSLLAIVPLSHARTTDKSVTPDTIVKAADIGELKGPLVAAHRGGFFGAQNTLRQFLATMSAGDADILEMDLQSTRDGAVVVYHDPELQSKTDCSGTIDAQDYQQVRNCRLHNGELLPQFEDVLKATQGRIIVNAEFKTDAVIAPAIRLVTDRHDESGVYFQVGSDRRKYAEARRDSADVYLQFKVENDADITWVLALNDPRLNIIEMDRDFISPDRIREAHGVGKLVSENSFRYQYTEERFSASCGEVFSQGVDIAVTNNPVNCTKQRNVRTFGFADRWVYGLLSREHMRPLVRKASSVISAGSHRIASLFH
jgi:glycerophosphoryl diester phosphodiesterase